MAKPLDELLLERPGDPEAQATYKERMLAEVRAYKLRELREMLALTQTDVAEVLAISQKRVSEIERQVDRTKVGTLRRYADALGGTLRVEGPGRRRDVPDRLSWARSERDRRTSAPPLGAMGDRGLEVEATLAGACGWSGLDWWRPKTGAHDVDEVGLYGRVDRDVAHPLRLHEGHGLVGHTWQLHSEEVEPLCDAVLDDLGQPVVDTVEQPVEL